MRARCEATPRHPLPPSAVGWRNARPAPGEGRALHAIWRTPARPAHLRPQAEALLRGADDLAPGAGRHLVGERVAIKALQVHTRERTLVAAGYPVGEAGAAHASRPLRVLCPCRSAVLCCQCSRSARGRLRA